MGIYSHVGGGGQEDGNLLRGRVIPGETALTVFAESRSKGGGFLWNWSNWAKDRIQGWGLVRKKALFHHLNNKALGLKEALYHHLNNKALSLANC